MKIILKTKHYVIKDVAHDAVVAQSFAISESDVKLMAMEQGFDLEGCIIECVNENPRTFNGDYIQRKFEKEF